MLSWFNRANPEDVWDDPVEQPLGDIEAAQRIRAICHAATGDAENIGASNGHPRPSHQPERERYERAARVAMEIATKVSDGLVRDAAMREIVGLCMKGEQYQDGAQPVPRDPRSVDQGGSAEGASDAWRAGRGCFRECGMMMR